MIQNTPPSVTFIYRFCHFLCFTFLIAGSVIAQSRVSADELAKQQADSLFNVGDRLLDQGAYSQAKPIFEKTKEIYQKLNLLRNAGNSINRMALVYYYQGNYTQTLRLFEQSKVSYQKANDVKGVASALNNMGGLHYFLGNKLQALNLYKQVISLKITQKDPQITAATTHNIGMIYRSIKDYGKALVYYQKAYVLFKELKDSVSITQSLNGIGEIYLEKQQYPQAYQYFNQSLTLANQLNHKLRKTEVLYNLGSLSSRQHKPDQAFSYYNQSLAIAQQTHNTHFIGNLKIALGNLLQDTEKQTQAVESCREGLKIAETLGTTTLKLEACECLYKAYKSLGNKGLALDFHERVIAYKDSQRIEEMVSQTQAMQYQKQQLLDSVSHARRAYLVQQKHKEEVKVKEEQRNLIILSSAFLSILAIGLWSRLRFVGKSKKRLQKEKDRSENLLLNILPKEIAEELKEKGSVEAQNFSSVAILFSDFKSFTQTAEQMTPQQLVEEINICFRAFDLISEKYNIEKIKTIGDAYMAAGGLPNQDQAATRNIVLAALDMQEFITARKIENDTNGKPAFEMRIGIHSGSVVAGIVGVKKFQYDVWGDTVNTASRMESNSEPGKVNVSETVYYLLKDDSSFTFQPRGSVNAKGKGDIQMYFVEKKRMESLPYESVSATGHLLR